MCRPCRHEYDHERHQRRTGTVGPRRPQRSERTRGAWLRSLKEGRPCADCGRVFPHQVMQWDHRPGFEKIGYISVAFWGRSRQEVLAEIAKCDLVCANSHAIRTFERAGWARNGSPSPARLPTAANRRKWPTSASNVA
jgi:hypothetical protein